MTPQCKYIPLQKTAVPSTPSFCKADVLVSASATGLFQYNSYAFNGAYNGNYFMTSYFAPSWRINQVTKAAVSDLGSNGAYPSSVGLAGCQLPGGAHVISAFLVRKLLINYPVDPVLTANRNPTLYDILPDRAAKVQAAKNSFIIGGENFKYITGALSAVRSAASNHVHTVGPLVILFWAKQEYPLGLSRLSTSGRCFICNSAS